MQAPCHPGLMLVEDVLPPLGLTLSQAAAMAGLFSQLIHKLRN